MVRQGKFEVTRTLISIRNWIVLPLIVLLSWLVFCLTAAVDYSKRQNPWMVCLFIFVGVLPLAAAKIAADTRAYGGLAWRGCLRNIPGDEGRAAGAVRRMVDRTGGGRGRGFIWSWCSSAITEPASRFLVSFKNLSLLSCFLGLGMGYALGRLRLVLTPLVVPLLAIKIVTMHLLGYANIAGRCRTRSPNR